MDIFWDVYINSPDSKVHGANMGPTWALLAPDGPHVGPINLAIWAQNWLTVVTTVICILLIYDLQNLPYFMIL